MEKEQEGDVDQQSLACTEPIKAAMISPGPTALQVWLAYLRKNTIAT